MLKLLFSLILTAPFATTAMAADPQENTQIIPQAPEVVIDTSEWGGFYLGAFGSYDWFSATASGLGSANENGFSGGGYVGYNWDLGNQWVGGVEANVGFGMSDTTVGTVTIDQDWDASLRGRLGYAYERSLIYSFAGLAMTGVEASALTGSDDQTLTGFNVGAGFETELFEDVTGRIEYGFSDYSSEGFALGAGANPQVDLETQNINVGIGLRF